MNAQIETQAPPGRSVQRFVRQNPMLYHIQNLCPRADLTMGGCGFSIALWPAWRDAIAARALNRQNVNAAIQRMARMWLDACGYDRMYDPDNHDPMAEWEAKHMGKTLKLGPNARHLYGPESIRVQWGEWGPEHITVPGDACGLDLDDGIMSPDDGRILVPHNVDSIRQAHLLLVVFLWFAEDLVLNLHLANTELRRGGPEQPKQPGDTAVA